MLTSFVAVDTETTGLDFEHDHVIELAAVRFENGKPVADFTALIAPGDRALSPVSRLITGLTDAELDTAPPAEETWRAFLAFVGETPLVAHNAEFDAHFVGKSLTAAGLPLPPGVWVDSLLLTRVAWPMWDSHRLDSLAERLQVPRDAEHRALPDARRAGYVFDAAQHALRNHLSPQGWSDLTRLAETLPDWCTVFHGASPSEGASPVGEHDRPQGVPSAPFAEDTDAGVSAGAEDADEALADALQHEGWLALEIPPRVEEHAAGLRAACAAAKTGQRVLLAVPDLFAWNALRKSLASLTSFSTELQNVRCVALAHPSGYLSRTRLRELLDDPARIPAEERAALLPLVAWADRNPDGPVADGRGFSPERARLTWSRVCCDTWADDASARNAREEAAHAGVILVTHATLCAHLASEGALLPACDSLIVTGAHRLPETLQSPAGAGRAVSLSRLREILQMLRAAPESATVSTSDGAANGDAWFEPERQLLKFLQNAGRHAMRQRPHGDFRVAYTEPALAALGADPTPVLEALQADLDYLSNPVTATTTGMPEEAARAERQRLSARLAAFRNDFAALCEAARHAFASGTGSTGNVYWMEDGSNPPKASLRSAPVSGELFGETLRGLFGAGVFLSPALIAGTHPARDARFVLEAIGIAVSGHETDSQDAPLVVRRISDRTLQDGAPHFLMTPGAPFLGTGEQAEEFARFFAEAALPFTAQGVRVFCPSQTALRALYGALRRLVPEGTPLWAQHLDGNRDAILRLYASGRGGIVLTAEGLPGLRDLDGKEPALWAVTRMPLPPPRDPLLEARGEALCEAGGNAKLDLWQPAAILRLKRDWSVFRSAEATEGTKVIWLLDGRAAAEGLGSRFAGALGLEAVAPKDLADLQTRTAEAVPGSAFRPLSQGLS